MDIENDIEMRNDKKLIQQWQNRLVNKIDKELKQNKPHTRVQLERTW